MAEYLHPGVFVEERSSGVRPIEGVGTSTAGFVGATARGVPNKATFVTTFRAFVSKFGDVAREGPYLPYAVEQFFANGGRRCYVVRALSDASSLLAGVTVPARENAGAPRSALRIEAKGKGAWGNAVAVRVEDGSLNPTREFRLVVLSDGVPVEVFDDLSMDPASPSFVETAVNDTSETIQVLSLAPAFTPPGGVAARATRVTTAALANPQIFGAGATVTLAVPDGRTNAIDLAALSPITPDALVTAINSAWGAFNLIAFITAASDPAGAGRLRVRHNAAGYDAYFMITLAAAAPLAGLDGFAQGAGAALGGTLKSAPAPGGITIAAGPANVLTFTVAGTALPDVALAVGANRTPASIVAELATAFAAPTMQGRLRASLEGDRVVVATNNLGNTSDARLQITGTAAAAFTFTALDGSAPAGGVLGFGRHEPAFVQSDNGPFTLDGGASQEFLLDSDAAGAGVIVTYALGAVITNLQAVTSAQVVTTINNAAAGRLVASEVGGRVIVRHARRGPYHRLRVEDRNLAPNIRLKFDGLTQLGYADGDAASPYFRPAANFVAGVNEGHALTGGDDGAPVSNFDLIGTADRKTGLHAFDDISDVNFIAVPGAVDAAVVGAAAGYCDTRGDCFFIADAPGKRTKDTPTTEPVHVREHMANRITPKNGAAALYYPWLEIADRAGAGKNPRRFVPPSGFVAGLYARIDATRGVWKAPAGTEATLIGPIGLEYAVTDAEQDILNPIGVNCVRSFPGSGIVVWGARTFAAQSDPERRYVPVRRYTIYLKQSIYRGTQWSVFEPNDAPLWAQLKANIDDFMMGEFRRGALAGTKPDDAFVVKCDAELNPPSEVNAGRVNMEVLFAPLKPAEFVIIRISQKSQRPQS